jgi:transcriptional regulator with XRE-family HTH domain
MTAMGYAAPMAKKKQPKMGPYLKTAMWMNHILLALDMSQEAFAERAGLSRGGVAKLLYGITRPRFDTLEKVRAAAPPDLRNIEVEVDDNKEPFSRPTMIIAKHLERVPTLEERAAVASRLLQLLPEISKEVHRQFAGGKLRSIKG